MQDLLNALQASFMIAQIVFSVTILFIAYFAWRDFRRLVDHFAPQPQAAGYEEYEEEEEEPLEEESEIEEIEGDEWEEGADDVPDRVK